MPSVRPEILIWARQSAGFSIEEAVTRLRIKDARGIPATERLSAIEAGTTRLSRPLLLRMAKLYHRPLITFYLGSPPRKGDRGEDFRNLRERNTGAEPLVDALVRDVRARQRIIRSILEDEEDLLSLPFVGSLTMAVGVGPVLASIRRSLRLDLTEYRAQASPEGAFALLRDRVEAIGVFVLLIGNLGSHHSAIDVSVFRGFALADPVAPFIVINDQDARAAWSFTLLHELAHIWLGSTGVSGQFSEARIERFCNDVASTFLLPANELSLIRVTPQTDKAEAARLIEEFANERLVSRSMVAYRLFREGALEQEGWRALTEGFHGDWLESRAAQRARNRNAEGGPDYYVVRRHRLGAALLRFVARNMSEGGLSPTKASKVLGVKPRNIAPLLSGAALPGEAP
jgi:Zn-dependent peptidase ImmA (M78 family)